MEFSWLVIINPNACSRKVEKDWPYIRSLLQKYNIDFHFHFSKYHKHTITLVKNGIEKGFRKIIAIGGDGTINEVVNGIFLQEIVSTTEITLGAITIGTGNDWGRMFNIPTNYEDSILAISRGQTFEQDAGIVNYHNGQSTSFRYFINIAGLGFDSIVAGKSNYLKQKGKQNSFSYLSSFFTILLNYKHHKSIIHIDKTVKTLNTKLFSMNVGICQYNGRGMRQVPYAIPDDGYFDLTIITKISKLSVINHISKLYKGSHLKLPFVKFFRAKSVFIDSYFPIGLEVDGESLGHTPIEFNIIPKSIKVIVG